MSFLSTFVLVTALLPQGQPAAKGEQDNAGGKPAVLTPNERTALRDKLAKYLADDAAYLSTEGKQREKWGREREKTKGDFEDAWKKAEAKGNVLASMSDLRGIWENCFLVKQPSSVGSLRAEKTKSGHAYAYWLPKSYKATTPTRTLWLIPGAGSAAGTWTKAQDWFNATWDKSATAGDSIFHITVPPEKLDMDMVPDFTREAGYEEEQKRIELMWETFGQVLTTTNVERSRVFLDCGRASCGFGLRFMTMFPDRFAGAVLRAPTAVEGIRLGSLLGIPILLLRTPATADAVDAVKKQIEAATPDDKKVTVLDATDEYPHRGHTADIEAWMGKQRRNALPAKVVIEPNNDKFKRAYWAKIETATSLVNAPADKKPRLECSVDRVANRIIVKTVAVETLTLFLNDELIDLDKEFTVVVNDKAFPEKRVRSWPALRDHVVARSDWDFLFPVSFTTAVPK